MLHVPTTDEMDSTTPEERRKLSAMCDNCGTWKHFIRKDDQNSATSGLTCDNCGGHSFKELISQRTFDADRAKKITAKLLRGKKK